MYQKLDNSDLYDNTCIICYHGDISGNEIVSLNDLNYISCKCKCNGKIHKKCVIKWYITKKRCIMCNTPVVMNSPNTSQPQVRRQVQRQVQVHTEEISMDVCTKRYLLSAFIVLLFLIIIYIGFTGNLKGFVLLSSNNKTNDYDNHKVSILFH